MLPGSHSAGFHSFGPYSAAAARGYRLAGMAALAYSLVIIYASLQPFTGWRVPAEPFGSYLHAPWPRWITVDDVVFNFAAYFPLGFLLAISLRGRWNAQLAVLSAVMICAVLSLVLESAQLYLPARFASNVDLLVNACGGAAGALCALLFAPGQRLGHALVMLRARWFTAGPRGDAVLVLAGLWVLTQLHAPLIALGNGDLRGSFELPRMMAYAPTAYLLVEAGIVALNVAGLGLMLASVARDTAGGFWRALLLLIAGACALRGAAALVLLQPPNPWNWLTPGLGLGLATAMPFLLLLTRAPHRARAALALVALVAALVLVNMAPENPYRPVPAYLLAGRTGHFLNLTGIARALSDLWPFLAISVLLFSLPARYERHP